MKNLLLKFMVVSLIGTLVIQPGVSYSASQWTVGDPQGTESSGTIDDIIRINNEATDRLLIGYKRGMGVNYVDAGSLSVLSGEIAVPNAAGSVVRWRRTTSSTAVTWSDIDTGSEENSTQYYLYATADTDITGVVFKISKSAAPSGSTYYKRIAEFYNNSSGNITALKSIRNDDGTDYSDIIKAWVNFTGTGTVAINDSYNVSSVTDNGTGDYTVSWTNAFASANYAVVAMAEDSGSSEVFGGIKPSGQLAGSVRIEFNQNSAGPADSPNVSVIAIGDRA